MTRDTLNTVLIDAVKDSVAIDGFPCLRTFAEIREIEDIGATNLNKDSLGNDGPFFYSARSAATGRMLEVEPPMLLLIENQVTVPKAFTQRKKEFVYELQLIVAFPNERKQECGYLAKERMAMYCAKQLDYVINYIINYNDENQFTNLNKKLQIQNESINISLNENYLGYAIAFTTINFPECVEYDFETSTRTVSCC